VKIFLLCFIHFSLTWGKNRSDTLPKSQMGKLTWEFQGKAVRCEENFIDFPFLNYSTFSNDLKVLILTIL
jgi:hypothetical protein